MFAFLRRRKAAQLIWQYLDGVLPQDRFARLERMLLRHDAVRRQFADCAALNAMLLAYFNPGRYASLPAVEGHPQPIDPNAHDADAAHHDEPRERRTKRPAG